jgi:hypothetical protein
MPAAFGGLGTVALVGQKMVQRPQQPRAEASEVAVRAGEGVLGEQAREKALRQILRVTRSQAAPADLGVDREPVGTAKGFEGGLRGGSIRAAGGLHQTPAGGHEVTRPGERRPLRLLWFRHAEAKLARRNNVSRTNPDARSYCVAADGCRRNLPSIN